MEVSVGGDTSLASRDYQFDSIKEKIEGTIDNVVHKKCNNLGPYDPR